MTWTISAKHRNSNNAATEIAGLGPRSQDLRLNNKTCLCLNWSGSRELALVLEQSNGSNAKVVKYYCFLKGSDNLGEMNTIFRV